MADRPESPDSSIPAPTGQARLLASGSLVQQFSQVTGLVAMFAIITVLARRLSLAEFGVYGLLTSLAGYLLVIQNAAASAAVRNMAAARDDARRTTAFSTAVVIYAVAGGVTGLLIALVGVILSAGVDLSPALRDQAIFGSLLLGLVIAVGWPITIYRDALRASQLFVRAALIEVASLLVYGALMLALVFGGASLAVLIGASGTIPMLAGLGAALAARARGLPYRFSRSAPNRDEARSFARLAGYVSATEAAGTVIYGVGRVLLGLFQSAATVGLFEGPIRAHNLIRALNAATSVTVLPTASRFFAESDRRRLVELLVTGTRYTLALSVPLTVTGMVLAPVALEVWLGSEFRAGGLTMTILLSYWLLNGCTGVIGGILVAGERARTLARLAWAGAVGNVVLSLALTPWLGLEGVAIGLAVPYFVLFPFVMRAVLELVPVSLGKLVREGFLPAYTLAVALAAALTAVRVIAEPDQVASLLGVATGGVLAYWIAFYVLWLRPGERRLVRQVAGGFVPRRARIT